MAIRHFHIDVGVLGSILAEIVFPLHASEIRKKERKRKVTNLRREEKNMVQSQPNRHISPCLNKICTGWAKKWRVSGRKWQKASPVKKYFCVRERHFLPRKVTKVTCGIFCQRNRWQKWRHPPKTETGTWEEIRLRLTLSGEEERKGRERKKLWRGVVKWWNSSGQFQTSLGGADFEIILTNNLPAHHLWAGSFHFPPRARCSFRGRPARPAMLKAKRPISWYQDRAGLPRTSKILKPLSVSLVMTPPRHHLPTLPSEIGKLRQNWH